MCFFLIWIVIALKSTVSGACYSGKTKFAMEQPPLDHRMTRRMLFRLNAVGYGICTAFKDMYLHIYIPQVIIVNSIDYVHGV